MTPQENVPEPTGRLSDIAQEWSTWQPDPSAGGRHASDSDQPEDQPIDWAAAVEQLRAEMHAATDALRQLLEGSTRILALTPGQQLVLFLRPEITTQAEANTVRSALQTWFPDNPVGIVLGVDTVTVTDPPHTHPASDPANEQAADPDNTPTTP